MKKEVDQKWTVRVGSGKQSCFLTEMGAWAEWLTTNSRFLPRGVLADAVR